MAPDRAGVQVDTNVLLRFFLQDEPEQRRAASSFVRQALLDERRIVVSPSTASEGIFVLTGPRLRRPAREVVAFVELVLAPPFHLLDRAEVELALALFRGHHDDWDDCLLAAYPRSRAGGRVASFDRALERVPGLTRLDPRTA